MQKIIRMRTWMLAGLLWGWAIASFAQTLPLPLRPGRGGFAPEGTRMVVKFKASNDSKGRRVLPNVRNHYVLQQLGVEAMPPLHPGRTAQLGSKRAARPGGQPVDLSRLYLITVDHGHTPEEAVRLLESDPAVEYAEPLYENFRPLYVPNDPQAQPGTGGQYHLTNIRAYQAWDIEKGNPSVTIGVVDFGTDVGHEDLRDNIQYNTADPVNGLDDDNDGYVDNYAGWNVGNMNNALLGNMHGSFVAGMLAGTPDNGKGIAGIGFRCKFLPVTIDALTAYEGLIYAVDQGCKIINLSWGRTGPPSRYEQDLINYAAINHDAVVVAAAGNSNNTDYLWPASYDNVISVAASEQNDLKGFLSNYNDRVDISAPGIGVYSTNNGGYEVNSGTSFSAPLVSGAAALLRSRFPNLTAAEITDRLLATADPIEHLPGNANFVGRLGKGRLNVYRALTESKGVKLISSSIGGGQDQPDGARKRMLTIEARCALGSFDNLRATLSSNSPWVTVTAGDAVLGALPTLASATNNSSPFAVTIAPEAPADALLPFTVTFRDGTFTTTEPFVISARQDYLTVNVNQLQLTATSRGRIGYNDDLITQGIGVRYKGKPLLFEAGLMIGTSSTRVSNCVRNHVGMDDYLLFAKDDHFRADRPIWFDQSNGADFSAAVTLTDAGNLAPIGLRIRQQVYAWKDNPLDKAVVFEYKITNVSGADLPQLSAGLFADWDIHGFLFHKAAGDKAAWDAARGMGYAFNPASGSPYAGIQLLTTQTSAYYVFDDIAGINTYDGFSPAEKYQSLTASGAAARLQSHSDASDVSHALSAQLGGLKNGGTITLAFAILAGDNLADLQAQADAIRQKFIAAKTSPLPVIAHPGVCVNGVAEITPSGGSSFKLYARQSDTAPVLSGGSFNLGPIARDTTVYVSGVDSLYESARVAVTVQAVASQAAFTVNRDTLGIFEGHVLEPADGSTNAVTWQWDFGDGSTAREASPRHAYTAPGAYTVTLTTTNRVGCPSTASRQVWVLAGLKSPAPAVTGLSLCPGQAIRIVPGNGGRFRLYAALPLTQPIATGAAFELPAPGKDTVLYVTGADFLEESEPVAVPVRVFPVRATFGVNATRLDLREEDVLRLTDRSTGAEAWRWTFGDGATSQAQHPVHAYAQPGEYTVTLCTRNALGCTDSTSQKITVFRTLVPGLDNAVTLYPNPSDGTFHLKKDNGFLTDRISVTVTDVIGREILQKELDAPGKITDLSIPGKGLYQVRIRANGQTVLRRVWVR